ncbi:hypothetical protein Tco_0545860, partial [Tanacetum coccineum]
YVVPTGRVVVPTGRYVVPAGKVIIIVSPGRLSLVPTCRVLSPGSKDLSRVGSNKWYQSLLRVSQKKNIPRSKILINLTTKHLSTPLKWQDLTKSDDASFPYLKKDEYEVWAMKMEYWITNNDMNIWKRESKARITLLQSIPDDHVADFHYMDDVEMPNLRR